MLAMITHNPIFTSIHHALMRWLSILARASATRAKVFGQHQGVYDAIEAGDTAAAENAMETHLATVARYSWQAMSTANSSAGPKRPAIRSHRPARCHRRSRRRDTSERELACQTKITSHANRCASRLRQMTTMRQPTAWTDRQ
jgi:hypothetical protein